MGMSKDNNETSAPSNFGAFIPIQDTDDSDNDEDEEEIEEEDEYNNEESFQGDYNDGEEYGNQVDLFEVHFGISSSNSDKHNDLSYSDILPEDFFKTTYL